MNRLAATTAFLLMFLTACTADTPGPRDAGGSRTSSAPAVTSSPGDDGGSQAASAPPIASGAWQQAYLGETGGALKDIVVSGPGDAWAIGATHTEGSEASSLLLLRFDGTRWNEVAAPSGLNPHEPVRLAAAGSREVWLLGRATPGKQLTAFRWDGSQWRSQGELPPWPGMENAWVSDLKTAGPDNVWAVYGGEWAHHWDGHGWRAVRLPASAVALSGGDPGDLWAVGHRATEPQEPLTQPATMRLAGGSWRLVPSPEYRFPPPGAPEEESSLSGVSMLDGKGWAIGMHTFNHGEVENEPEDEVALVRWDGTTWRKVAMRHKFPYCCHKLASDDGDGFVMATSGRLLRESWHVEPAGDSVTMRRLTALPETPGKGDFFAVEAMAFEPDGKTVWAVGSMSGRGTQERAAIARLRLTGR
ncbi:hypothetical protein [Sinosporangium siamense]|uniref:Exo-alpha-sialidase n=1 Tax=Sinosporangium siamense TaxID=1367973 RepID=A0A919VBG0_9ACTN|nr:hypothetical protein [Sinosporangium siamense]GII97368.1 hypothetical protein Ssi02_75990 [Sinosporangium siamense]